MRNFLSEDDIEVALLEALMALSPQWERLNAYTYEAGDLNDNTYRSDKAQMVLPRTLQQALRTLNPELPTEAIEQAAAELSKGRRTMTLINANREVYRLIREGVPVEFTDEQGKNQKDFAQVIDYRQPERNTYTAVQQLWIKGEIGYRRPDVILYINGLPVVLIELKNSNVSVRQAYTDNLATYKQELPQLFWYNALTILSNARETRAGAFTASWEHFGEWLREAEADDPDRKKIARDRLSLSYTVQALLQPHKLLDYIENFLLFHRDAYKIAAKNHQFLGVNEAAAAFAERQERAGKLGVFWHTQGSGKSYSMVFFTRKILRQHTGNFTFLIVTDRLDLDRQIYRNFLHLGTCTKADTALPRSSQELREVLQTNKKYIFTLIQRFRYDKGKDYPLLSERSDIIVIVDEAHRTQYANLAENMRTGLPNAQYIAFTGTPLLGKEKKTNAWFGEYVSEYNFAQAVADGATVPLFYDKRLPEVHIANDDLSEELAQILEDEHLDEQQQRKLENKYAKEMEVIKRDDRLETIARDIAYHFPRRGYLGKGMVICVDKYTTVKMHDKVNYYIKEQQKELRREIARSSGEAKAELQRTLRFLNGMQTAVVISEEADEEQKFADRGLHIKPHRDRLHAIDEHGHTLEDNFKDPEHPLQLVFVCAMWLTGFDAPTVSTLYLDKPMQNHTLMQTIARANRVAPPIDGVAKKNGLVVDYYNVFRNLKRALKDYGQGEHANPDQNPEGKDPVQPKSELMELLDESIKACRAFCDQHEIDLQALLDADTTFSKLERFNDYADILLSKDELRKEFTVYDNTCYSLYEACRPDILKHRQQYRIVEAIHYLRGVVDQHIGQADVERASHRISELLDQSVLTVEDSRDQLAADAESPQFHIKGYKRELDLSKFNFDKLREEFPEKKHQNIEIADLRAFLSDKLRQMLEENTTRAPFLERFQNIIDRYNAGGRLTEDYFADLVQFAEDLRQEDERHIRLGLEKEELELFDLLKKDKLTKAEEQAVKNAARHLLKRLKEEQPRVLVQDWHRDTQSRRHVKSAIEEVLDSDLPQNSYGRKAYKEVCDRIYDHIFVQASRGEGWLAA